MKTTRRIATPFLIVASSLLVACGGGSDNGGSNNSGGTGNSGSNDTVTLSATVIHPTVCNTQVPATNAELVVYDNNWAIKSRHTPDATGKINAVIPKTDFVNISLITNDGEGSARRISVNTFTQHPVGDLGIFQTADVSADGCECQTTNLTVTTGQWLEYPPQLIGYNSNKAIAPHNTFFNSYEFNNVEICRVAGGNWPTLYAATHWSETPRTAGYLSSYDPSDELVIDLEYSPTTYSANFDPAASSTSVMHHFGDAYISYSAPGSSSDIELFDNFPDFNAVSLRVYDSYSNYYENIEVRQGRTQRYTVAAPYSSTVSVTLPDSEEQEKLMQAMLAWLSSDSNNYDLSNINNFETFFATLTATLTDGSSYTQTFYGPNRGVIPENVLPTDYGVEALLDEESLTFYFSMIRYGERQSYQQYLASSVTTSRLTLTERLLGNRSQYSSIFVDISQ